MVRPNLDLASDKAKSIIFQKSSQRETNILDHLQGERENIKRDKFNKLAEENYLKEFERIKSML